MHVRRATIQDAPEIAKAHVDTWRTTYEAFMSKQYLDSLTYEHRTKLWEEQISNPEQHIFVLVNEMDNIRGFAACNARKKDPQFGDLSSIYIMKEDQRKGYGRLLLRALFEAFDEMGCEKVFVEVLAENKARNLYEYYGANIVEIDTMMYGMQELEFFIYKWDSVKNMLAKL